MVEQHTEVTLAEVLGVHDKKLPRSRWLTFYCAWVTPKLHAKFSPALIRAQRQCVRANGCELAHAMCASSSTGGSTTGSGNMTFEHGDHMDDGMRTAHRDRWRSLRACFSAASAGMGDECSDAAALPLPPPRIECCGDGQLMADSGRDASCCCCCCCCIGPVTRMEAAIAVLKCEGDVLQSQLLLEALNDDLVASC